MAVYFDPVNTPADANMLPPGIRKNVAELANLVPVCEAAVIGWYTMNPPYFFYTAASVANVSQWIWPSTERGGGEDISAQNQPATASVPLLRVYLQGYKVDANDPAVDPNFKLAMRITIAVVTAWTLRKWRALEPGVASSSSGAQGAGGSRTFRPYADDAFPPQWHWMLAPYDSRPVAWAL
jgi:hypothetical protein